MKYNFAKDFGGSGTSGTSDYEDLSNKPKINGTVVIGDKSSSELGLEPYADAQSINVDNMGDAQAKSIDLDELPKICGYESIIMGSSAPNITPDYVGQTYIDKTNKKVYVAAGVSSAADFMVLN